MSQGTNTTWRSWLTVVFLTSVFAREVILLSPCLRQLPTEYYGFKDQEQRHRQRFLDLAMNDSTRETFITRTKIVKYM
jgi:lysyl-tRNA synthetase, class II